MSSIAARRFLLSLTLMVGVCWSHAQQDRSSPAQRVALLKGYTCDGIEYPAAARRRETQGVTQVRFTAEPDGKIADVVVVKSSGETKEHKLLDLVSKRQIQSCTLVAAEPTLEARTHTVDLVWKLR